MTKETYWTTHRTADGETTVLGFIPQQDAPVEADDAITALMDTYHAEGSKSWKGFGVGKYRLHDGEITVTEQEISDEELREILSLEVALMLP